MLLAPPRAPNPNPNPNPNLELLVVHEEVGDKVDGVLGTEPPRHAHRLPKKHKIKARREGCEGSVVEECGQKTTQQ